MAAGQTVANVMGRGQAAERKPGEDFHLSDYSRFQAHVPPASRGLACRGVVRYPALTHRALSCRPFARAFDRR